MVDMKCSNNVCKMEYVKIGWILKIYFLVGILLILYGHYQTITEKKSKKKLL